MQLRTCIIKISIRRDGKSPNLKVNDKQLQTAKLGCILFDDIILSVNASLYGMMTINELTSFPYKVHSRYLLKRVARGGGGGGGATTIACDTSS